MGQRSWPVAFFVRYVAAVLLMAVGSGCIPLVLIVAPTPVGRFHEYVLRLCRRLGPVARRGLSGRAMMRAGSDSEPQGHRGACMVETMGVSNSRPICRPRESR